MTRNHWFWKLPRPTLMWCCVPLLFAGLHPDVTKEKFALIVGITVALFFFRGVVDKGWIERILTIWRGVRS